ncbi:MAG TPA: NUDIX hydrolase [Pseudonocardiaceae bacterium]
MAAGVVFRDRRGRVLLVEPSYKPNWELPGGAVDHGESPWAAARRELREELGWDRPVGRLLVVDHVLPHDDRTEGVVFVFDGGVVHDDAELRVDGQEIRSFAWLTPAQARSRVKPLLADRLSAAVAAAETDGVVLCEHGRRVA